MKCCLFYRKLLKPIMMCVLCVFSLVLPSLVGLFLCLLWALLPDRNKRMNELPFMVN